MKSLFNNKEAQKYVKDPLKLRVYTSRLLGQNPDLVLHGGGNTSVKTQVKNRFGETEDILYVKGSGWDLGTIEAQGFAPVRMDTLLKMAELKTLKDSEMVSIQRSAMIDPYAPNPSVEAILHAIIPFKFVDHTHADAVVTVTNTPKGEKYIQEIYGDRVLVIPYVMPGFILAREIYQRTRGMDWSKIEGMVLLNHGIFTFHDDAKKSYEKMIALVNEAEDFIKQKKASLKVVKQKPKIDLPELASIRREVSRLRGKPVIVESKQDDLSITFSRSENLSQTAKQGPLTPDHIIRTKRIPVITKGDPKKDLDQYAKDYKEKYFKKYKQSGQTCLDAAPRWGVWPGHGTLAFGVNAKENKIASDIIDHTMKAILEAEKLGSWKALPVKDLFEMEYWELEQAKLKKVSSHPVFQGKIALVTGAASGIGKACAQELVRQGASVAVVDIDKSIQKIFKDTDVFALNADLTRSAQVKKIIEQVVHEFGGLDMVVSNAGIFPSSHEIAEMDEKLWDRSLNINLTAHQLLLKHATPYLKLGLDPAVVIIGSKNVPAPGPGASAYSTAKAGLTQLARIAALELGRDGVRVNVVHPNQVFDTAIWTKDVLKKRAKQYNVSVEDYKKFNVLQTDITSHDVAQLVAAMLGPVFSKTTGAQVPIDGGNERVI